jgi:outer membrane receptor protein involved in Fe transport
MVASRRFGNLSLHLVGAYHDRAGTYADQSTGVLVAYHPFWLWDSRITWNLKAVSMNLDLNNVTNRSHTDFGGLRQPGRHINFSMQIRLPD